MYGRFGTVRHSYTYNCIPYHYVQMYCNIPLSFTRPLILPIVDMDNFILFYLTGTHLLTNLFTFYGNNFNTNTNKFNTYSDRQVNNPHFINTEIHSNLYYFMVSNQVKRNVNGASLPRKIKNSLYLNYSVRQC